MLQTWFNKCIPNVDCSVKRILKDGRVVINIKPAPAITELQKLSKETLTEKETEKGAGKGKKTTVTITSISLTLPSPELDTQLLTEDDSSEQDQQGEQSETGSTAGDQMGASFMPKTKNEHIQPGKESNTGSTTEEDSGTSPMCLQTEQVQVGKQSSRDPAGEEMYTCSVPVGHFWYVNHMYEEEMKLIEKENGVKIRADVKVRFEEDQKHGSPDNAREEFANLVQKSLVESSGSVIPLKFIESDQWGDALKTIQEKENKLLVTLTSETMTVRGPGQSQEAIKKFLNADTHRKRNTDASHQEYERETQESLKIDMTIKDDFPHAGLIIEKTFWKLMTNSYNKQIEKIKAKFNVAFKDSDIDQGKVNVTAFYKKEGNASMESHALRALLCLHQRFVSSQFHGATGFSGTIISQSEGASNEPVLNGQSANRKHNIDPPTDSGKRAGDQSDERCPICLDKFKNKRQLNCKHEFCKDCLKQAEKANGPICPICRVVFGKIVGDQPDGTMSHQILTFPLPGYSDCGTIMISYEIQSGTQTAKHPNPGQHYYGIRRTAYLPNNKEGNEVLRLLKKAFDQRLIFTIGTSRTTGMDGQVTWNDIHHKTSMSGGAESFGYPDPEYLSRVKEELKAKGIE
ncbi:E3 ubiquitin-protein ligase DTX3L-like isoform X2 [Pundamilia nyererei]|uniref:E3 ubiquitin-protein ligase n=1 Tax=Pundamilia nyererei TaxID=303518 RepID=A0A9Y6M9W2_9CICH|nr:PREDICTED: E3 ubiquitin-protein ligase DTX3L-like isoform X2 [Pundamilia nyererei]